MTDAREALVARQRDEYGASWDVLVPEVGWTLGRIIESVIEGVLAAGWTLPEEGKQPGCTGAGDCPATAHTHGCYADTEGHCEHPEEHRWTPPTVKPSVEDVAAAIEAETASYDPVTSPERGKPESLLAADGSDMSLTAAQAALALLPGRTEAEVKAEALREAAIYAPGGPVVSGWLRERADQWEETNRG